MTKKICFIYMIMMIFVFSVYSLGAELNFGNSDFSLRCRAPEFRPGELIVFEVRPFGGQKISAVNGAFLETAMEFYQNGDSFIALFGVPAKIAPGKYGILINIKTSSGKESSGSFEITIRKRMFKVSRLNVDPLYLEYTPETLRRIEEEKQILIALWKKITPDKLWNGPFIYPIDSDITQEFAVKRVFHQEFRSFHSGIDLRAKEPTEVMAANRGIVALTGDHFFSGNFVIIDHGRRLFSFYAHLSEIKVKDGQSVEKGQVIALSGSTGRITGPHLHWTIKVNSVNVDPEGIVGMNLY